MLDNAVRFSLYVLVLLCATYVVKVLRLAYDPDLRKIPGPFLNRFTNVPLKFHVLTANRMYYLHDLHKKYGPYVRISPNEITVADVQGVRQIHKIGTVWTKTSWYQGQTATQISDETCGVFGVRDPRKASHRRKFFQQAGTKAVVGQWESEIRTLVQMTISKIRRDALKDGKVDIMRWWIRMTTDVLGSLAFGEPFGMVETESRPQMIDDIEKTMINAAIKHELPVVFHFLDTVPIPGLENPGAIARRLEATGSKAVIRTKAALKGGTKTLFSMMYPEDGQQPFSDDLLSKESANMIVAGADTTAMTLTYLVWEVLTHPEVKHRLLQELSTCSAVPDWEELEGKPYLNNVIQETLRLRPAVGTLPRQAPAEGAMLGGYQLPGTTIALTTAYITHRDPVLFKDPERFDPDRWNNPSQEMKEAFMSFGGSARTCLGQNVARLEMLHAVSAFFRECPEAEMAPGMTWETVRPLDVFTVAPKGGKIEIVLQ